MTSRLHLPPGPTSFPESPLTRITRQPMMIGLFLPVQTGGFSQSSYPRETSWHFDYSKALTLRAEELGFDFVFGLQQWLPKGGFGGEIAYRENFLDPFISTVALGAVTSRIVTISTVHVLYGDLHPLYLARFSATADHIMKGRFGLNVVTGYDVNEPLMFGMERIEHDRRYDRAGEFASIMEDLWANVENLDYEGEFYRLKGAAVSPKPLYGRPVMVSASASKRGYDYAAEHSDIVFTSSPAGAIFENAIGALPEVTANIRASFEAKGRQGKAIIFPMIICKPTREESFAYRDAIAEKADMVSINAYTARHKGGDGAGWVKHVPADRVLGGHIQLIGSPEDIADQIGALHEAGIDGIQIGFYDYAPELEFFAANVLPLLEARGLRLPGAGLA